MSQHESQSMQSYHNTREIDELKLLNVWGTQPIIWRHQHTVKWIVC